MNELLEILAELHPEVDFDEADALLSDGILDSFDIVTLLSEVAEQFEVEIPAGMITPENFRSAASIYALIEDLGGTAAEAL